MPDDPFGVIEAAKFLDQLSPDHILDGIHRKVWEAGDLEGQAG